MAKFQAKRELFVGIDPGLGGGIAIVTRSLLNVAYFPMPDTERKLLDTLRSNLPLDRSLVTARIEWINPSIFGIKKSSSSILYGNYMACRMALTAVNVHWEAVMPEEWQRTIEIEPRRKKNRRKGIEGETTNAWKTRLLNRAKQLYPKLKLWKEPKGVQLCVSDAILISHFCWMISP